MVVDEELALPDLDTVAGQSHDALDPGLRPVAGPAEHHDIAALRRAAGRGGGGRLLLDAHQPVPPTVMRSIRSVGWPTPTGTPWPFLPQVPTPESSARSLPTMVMRCRSVGPLPISIAPFSGAPSLPFSIL